MSDPVAVWDFWSKNPESLHQIIYLMGDRGIPATYRHMHGFGSHTFSFINDKNQRFWVKFHIHTLQGIKNLTNEEAAEIVKRDFDSHQRDLYESIESRNYPQWKMSVQIMPEKDAQTYKFHPFDITKTWRHKDYPLIEIGIITLNRNPDNYFAEVEQSAFDPGNIVPGIGFSPDRLLQGRLFAYGDAQRYRLGINHKELPINAPKCPYHTTMRDGYMSSGHYGSKMNYSPSNLSGYKDNWDLKEPPLDPKVYAKREAERELMGKWDYREEDDDYYTQPNDLYTLMNEAEKGRVVQNISSMMKSVPDQIVQLQLSHFKKINISLAMEIENALKN